MVRMFDIARCEDKAFETRTVICDDLSQPFGNRSIAMRRHQFQRCIVEPEDRRCRAVVRNRLPVGRPPQQRRIDRRTGRDLRADEYGMVES